MQPLGPGRQWHVSFFSVLSTFAHTLFIHLTNTDMSTSASCKLSPRDMTVYKKLSLYMRSSLFSRCMGWKQGSQNSVVREHRAPQELRKWGLSPSTQEGMRKKGALE